MTVLATAVASLNSLTASDALKVDVQHDRLDTAIGLSPLTALIVLFVGEWFAQRRFRKQLTVQRADLNTQLTAQRLDLERQLEAERESAATRWQLERELEARKWDIQRKREAYAAHLSAVTEYVKNLQEQLAYRRFGNSIPDEVLREGFERQGELAQTINMVEVLASEEYRRLTGDVFDRLDRCREFAPKTDPKSAAAEADRLPSEVNIRALILQARSEVKSL